MAGLDLGQTFATVFGVLAAIVVILSVAYLIVWVVQHRSHSHQ